MSRLHGWTDSSSTDRHNVHAMSGLLDVVILVYCAMALSRHCLPLVYTLCTRDHSIVVGILASTIPPDLRTAEYFGAVPLVKKKLLSFPPIVPFIMPDPYAISLPCRGLA